MLTTCTIIVEGAAQPHSKRIEPRAERVNGLRQLHVQLVAVNQRSQVEGTERRTTNIALHLNSVTRAPLFDSKHRFRRLPQMLPQFWL